MKVRPRGARIPWGGRDTKDMSNSPASNEKHTDQPAAHAPTVREHSEIPAEGGVGQKKPEPRMHSQNAAEGPDDDS